MPRLPRLCLYLALGAAANACSPIEPTATTWEGKLEGADRLPDAVSGTVAAISRRLNTRAIISITGAEPGQVYLWRLREGTCQSPGRMIGGRASYPELQAGASGQDGAEATLSEKLRNRGTYHAAVFATGPDTGVVACGALEQR